VPFSFVKPPALALFFAPLIAAAQASGPAVVPPAEAADVLTLAAALTRAETANPTLLISGESVVQAQAAAHQSRAGILPNVTWDSQQRRARTASVGGALVRSGINNRFDSTLNGRLDLLDPQRIVSYQAAKVATGVAELEAAAVRQTMLGAVAGAFFTHLRNRSRTEVLDSNVARARSLLDLARRQSEAGIATQIDVTRAEAQLATAEQARLQQETVVAASQLQLKQLLAVDLVAPLNLERFVMKRAPASEQAEALETTALARRPDLQRAERLREQNDIELRAAKLDRVPSIAIIGSMGVATENVFDRQDTNVWSGIVALNVPVFDGQRIRSATATAASKLRAQEVRVRQLRLQIGAEVRLALQDTTSRRAQIGVAEKNRALAEDELRLARLRYEQGVADNREVVDAQNRLAQAADNLVEAVHQYNLSRVELARSCGDVRGVLLEKAP
jgi:outer membrane protein TolC